MNKYFECCIKYRKTDENGAQKITTNSYIVDALSFSEAEANIIKEVQQYISEEFRVTNIKLTNYSEVISSTDGDRWFKSKVTLVSYNEETGKEGKTNIYLLVQANDAKEAYDNTAQAMKTAMGDWMIPAVSETKLMDVFLPIVE